ncbi:YbaB/EbfC family DNA-binding protein [Amycolatopsis sp. cg5]|uniref:YbaB/EbfC family DNA-binding protein n=1 Tax=Amycolatopsis sp. cg5 TaxID=3238802 RepID=UPI0035253F85
MPEPDSGVFDLDRMAADALATMADERRKLGELGKLWNEERTTVRAKDQSFAMTFDGRGELVDLVFNGEKYRSLAPAQFASVLIETLQRGRAQSMAKMTDLMGLGAIPGLDLAGLATGQADPQEMVDALLAPMLEGIEGFDDRKKEQRDG